MPDGLRPHHAGVLVVGAGTAGCVVAGAVSADPTLDVVVLDAGAPTTDPALAGLDYLAGAAPGRFWEAGLVERVAGQPPQPYRSGRGLGGSAGVNGMVAVPPGDADLEAWAVAGTAWTPSATRATRDSLAPAWVPTPPEELGPLERSLAAASAATGLGSFEPLALERSGTRRAAVADRLLGPVLDRPNLALIGHAPVRRLLLDEHRAAGVVLDDGSVIEADTVVLAAGAIRSPALLDASGLGGALAGGRLSDHPSGTFTLHLRTPLRARFQTCGALRWRTPSGLLAELLPISRVGDGLAALTLAVMDPSSTGAVLAGRPGGLVARLGLLGDERDRVALREAIADTWRLLAQPPFAAFVERVSAGSLGVPADQLLDAPDELLDSWVATTGPLWHAACSLPLGSVLDERGRLPGVDGLRVVDASVLPVLPAVAPNVTVSVVAAHLAHLLRADA